MFTEQHLSPKPFEKITQLTHDEHLKLYAGYVKNANAILQKIPEYSQWSEKDPFVPYFVGELQRRLSFEFNGMRNHECYFKLLEEKNDPAEDSPLMKAITETWGSLDTFKTIFTTLATSTRGVGWAMLSWDPVAKILIMHWIDEQHLGQLQGTMPIIALDMWEHSYVADYQPSGKKQYVIDFLNALNWKQAEVNFAGATRIA